jgi:hypothetical protein
MEREKGPTCALFKGHWESVGLSPTFTRRASSRGNEWGVIFC